MAKKKKKSGKKNQKSFIGKLFRIIGTIILSLFIISILITILYRWVNPPVTPLMVIRKITNDAPIKKEWKDLEDISPNMVVCAVAAEDNNFLAHNGFDFGAIQKVVDERKTGKKNRGASTISQQTAKNVFLWPERSWIRKGGEVYFTFLIETFWSKERIMEVYLNVIEMGNGIYGTETAAESYFNTSAKKLTLRQAALITAIYPDPLHRDPAHPTSYLKRRASKIAALTAKFGKVKFDEKSINKAEERYQKREEKRRAKNDGKIIDLD
ncbi:MAG: monofunctional biosynthetic peptidoglycan transglycosylase [Bacteroidales bacterium]